MEAMWNRMLWVLACNNVQVRYIHGALRSGYATMRQFRIQPFLIRCIKMASTVVGSGIDCY